ncbi:hypothetical protein AB3S75_033937 [Citrus x aurantiifolia]
MAENLKPYDAPQQNRRNKRRFTTTTQTNQQEQPQPRSHIFQTNLTSFLQLNPPTKPPPASSSSSSSSLQSLHQTNFYTPFDPFPLNMHAEAQHYYSGFADSLKLQKSEVRSSVPWGPFTGYASILKRSRFLKPAQRILDEFCGSLYFDSSGSQVDSFCENPVVRDFIAFSDRIERSWKTSKLVLMLEEVYWKYKLYCQQMQSVVASFETVAGLGHAAPYISFAFKAISKHFCCLKNAILDQIHVSGSKTVSDKNANNDTTEPGCSSHKPVQKLGFLRPPHWRSQRALPDHAVAVLKTWLYENFLHPYPTDSDKQILAKQTGLSKNQVSNWFINARVRLWKPMVEEVHMLEIGQAQTTAEATNSNFGVPSDHLNTLFPEKLYQATQILQAEHVPTKHCRNKRAQAPEQNEEQKNACLSNLPSDQHIGFSGSSGMTLALALNQNDGNDLSRPFPVSVPRQFDLEMAAEADTEIACEPQNKHLG